MGTATLLVVPWMGPSANNIWAGVHWTKRKRMADEGHLATSLAVKAAKLGPVGGKVELVFMPQIKKRPRVRGFDCLNYAMTCKVIEDGLVRAGVLPDDSKKYVSEVAISAPAIADYIEADQMSVLIIQIED